MKPLTQEVKDKALEKWDKARSVKSIIEMTKWWITYGFKNCSFCDYFDGCDCPLYSIKYYDNITHCGKEFSKLIHYCACDNLKLFVKWADRLYKRIDALEVGK